MTPKHEYYDSLGVQKNASSDEIRRAFKRLARKYHPDLNPGDQAAEEHFKRIQEAYSVLTDPKKRQMYDQYGFYSENAQPGPSGGGFRSGQGGGFGFGGFDFTDFRTGHPGSPTSEPPFAGRGGGGFSDIFSQFFGGRGNGPQEQQEEKGTDLEYALNIDFWQAIRGTQIRLKINRQSSCRTCNGSGTSGGGTSACPECSGTGTVTQLAGAMRFNITCPACNGSGKVRDSCETCHGDGRSITRESVDVRIPPGAQSGSRLRVAGKGNAGSVGKPAGDLYITLRVDPHPFFDRAGDDILIEVPISVWEASLGTKIEVPTIDGRAILKIPQGTSNGQKFRLREKGVMNNRRGVRGDQIVQVVIEPPPARDERTREILRELSALHPEDPRAEIWSKVRT